MCNTGSSSTTAMQHTEENTEAAHTGSTQPTTDQLSPHQVRE